MTIRIVWIVSILLVVSGSLLPANSAPIRVVGLLPVSLKVLHFCGYAWLALVSLFTVTRRSTGVWIALAMILLGVAMEFGQRLIPGRAFALRDMAINGAGVLAGIAIGLYFLAQKRPRPA